MKKFKNEVVKFVGAVISGAAGFALTSWIIDVTDYDASNAVCIIFLAMIAYICVKGAELSSMVCKKLADNKKERKQKEIDEIAAKVARILKDEKIEP